MRFSPRDGLCKMREEGFDKRALDVNLELVVQKSHEILMWFEYFLFLRTDVGIFHKIDDVIELQVMKVYVKNIFLLNNS